LPQPPGISVVDIWRAANLLIRQYGADADKPRPPPVELALGWPARDAAEQDDTQHLGRRKYENRRCDFFIDYSMAPTQLAVALEERGFDSLWVAEHSHILAV
jgi:nitroreductase